MAKEIKDFEVWHPPPPPEDEPLIEDIKISEYIPWWLQRSKKWLTTTGILWLIIPCYLFFTKKLTFSITELMIWTTAWAGSAALVSNMLVKFEHSWPAFAIVLFIISHIHCVLFTGAIYQYRFKIPNSQISRLTFVLIPQLLPVAILIVS